MPHHSEKEQVKLLSSISNYHWLQTPAIISDKMSKDTTSRVDGQMLYYPRHDEQYLETNMYQAQNHIPTSPCLRLLYLTTNLGYEDAKMQFVCHLLRSDCPEAHQYNDNENEQEVPRPHKRRKQSHRIISISPENLSEASGLQLEELLNSASKHHTLYTKFQEDMLTEGIINWRLNDEQEGNICVMNDYNRFTGSFIPNNYVHVKCVKISDTETAIRCSCNMYSYIQMSNHHEVPLWPEEEYLHPTLTCMHCRFYKEHLVNAYEKICNSTTTLTRSLAMVKESLQYMNQPIQLLGNVIKRGTTKFSVKGKDLYSIVHISFYLGKCMTTCLDGICATLYKTHKKVPKRISISNQSKCCSHLNTMCDNIEYVWSFFPHYFEQNTDDIADVAPVPPQEDVNNEDENINVHESGIFNKETGLWNFKALSQHKPFDNMMDPGLIFATQERNDIVTSTNLDVNTGVYKELHLKPSINGKLCTCGDPYVEEVYAGTSIIYS